LTGIARREALYRRRQLRRQYSLDAIDPERGGPSVAGPAEEYARRIRAEQLYQALSRLPERQLTALLLFYEQNLSYAEIAKEVGCTQGAVGQLIHRALRRLGRMLADSARDVA
ncbi:MAG: sigma-70 family RNA polymerase sigma factor, partial [candidate division WOR-3 bacterium]